MNSYPSELIIEPLPGPPWSHTLQVPGSKSLTNRALIVAALATGKSTLTGTLDSEDTRVMVDSLQKLGFRVEHDPASRTITVEGAGGSIPNKEASLSIANSGTSLRFLTALAALGQGTFHLDGNPRMRERPVGDLLLALNRLGADVRSDLGTGCPPLTLQADRLDGGFATVRGDVSSQFLSALLMALPYARYPTTLEIDGTLVSRPYVDLTLAVMRSFGLQPSNHKYRQFNIVPGRYQGRTYAIEPDASAASYWLAAAAITGGTVTVAGLGGDCLQGDVAFADILAHMGCTVSRSPAGITVTGGPLRGVDVDMNPISDTVMTLAAVALFADGPTRIRNVAHIRHKETDRIAALATELRKFGATVHDEPDGLFLFPPARITTPAQIATYDDHRMAMALALPGLVVPGITILEPGCVAKTYPAFWTDMESLRRSITTAA